jgi:hypothetical protein
MRDFIIVRPEENYGMCGYIWQTIRAIYHNPGKKYYIDFSNSIYRVGNDNVWDWFYEQPYSNLIPAPSDVEKVVGIIFDQQSEFVSPNICPNNEQEIQKRREIFSNIISKYIHLKPEMQQKVDSFVQKNYLGKRVLGLHLRGTDHPNKSRISNYMQKIKDTMDNYDALFVCSDEHERFRMVECTFGDKVISWNSIRSKNKDTPLHSHPQDRRYHRNNTMEYQRKIAEDVVLETYLLSRTDFLMCCPGSNVNYLARAINPKLPYIEIIL